MVRGRKPATGSRTCPLQLGDRKADKIRWQILVPISSRNVARFCLSEAPD